MFRSRGTGGQGYRFRACQPFGPDRSAVLDQIRVGAQVLSDFHQPVRIRAVLRADHQHQVGLFGHVLYRYLPIFRGVADVLSVRSFDVRELLLEGLNDVFCFVEGKRGLGEVGDTVWVWNVEEVDGLRRTHNLGDSRGLAQSADNFVVIQVTYQDEGIALFSELDGLDVNLGYERAGCVDYAQVAGLAGTANFGSDAMS